MRQDNFQISSCLHLQPRTEISELDIRVSLDQNLLQCWPIYCSIFFTNLRFASKMSSLSRIRSAEAVRSKFEKVLVLHDDKLLCFDCSDQTRHTHYGVDA